MEQTWHDLLFAHWAIAPSELRKLLPEDFEPDTFHRTGWVGVVPFRMSHIHAKGMPSLPGISHFPELNVRTYVTLNDKPGVYFFSLDAASLPAVWAAKRFYHLPYFHAHMSATADDDWIVYDARRDQSDAAFRARYRPTGPVELRESGSLVHWLTERYCLYTMVEGRVRRAEIHHRPWPLQEAEAKIEINTMAAASGISLPSDPPLLHFARELQVQIWPLSLVG